MTKILAALLNQFYSGGVGKLGGIIAIFGSTYGIAMGITSAIGIVGNPRVFAIIVGISTLTTVSVFLLSPVRWAIVASVLKHNMEQIVIFRPKLIIGIGPGGSIIAGMLAKLLSLRVGQEPLVYVIDRKFERNGRVLDVSLSDISTSTTSFVEPLNDVLLVSSEVHTGNTMKRASDYLRADSITDGFKAKKDDGRTLKITDALRAI